MIYDKCTSWQLRCRYQWVSGARLTTLKRLCHTDHQLTAGVQMSVTKLYYSDFYRLILLCINNICDRVRLREVRNSTVCGKSSTARSSAIAQSAKLWLIVWDWTHVWLSYTWYKTIVPLSDCISLLCTVCLLGWRQCVWPCMDWETRSNKHHVHVCVCLCVTVVCNARRWAAASSSVSERLDRRVLYSQHSDYGQLRRTKRSHWTGSTSPIPSTNSNPHNTRGDDVLVYQRLKGNCRFHVMEWKHSSFTSCLRSVLFTTQKRTLNINAM